MEHLRLQVLFIIMVLGQFKESKRVWDNSPLSPKKATDLPLLFCMVAIDLVK